MLELAIKGGKKYYGWMTFLLVIIGIGFLLYLKQLDFGLGITGLSRDVSWGFYIANFTFLVGVAAGGVMVVLPYYLHDYKAFGKVTILGEFLAIASVIMCVTFILVDLGQPMRVLNVFLYPSPNSVLFWDTIVLQGYLLLNIVIGWNVLEAERNGVHPQKWLKPLIYLSIPWAISIHTVTAYLYAGLKSWLTRFASTCSSFCVKSLWLFTARSRSTWITSSICLSVCSVRAFMCPGCGPHLS
jgi:molybdopterin-containing oxidoreductase family membrane subunit